MVWARTPMMPRRTRPSLRICSTTARTMLLGAAKPMQVTGFTIEVVNADGEVVELIFGEAITDAHLERIPGLTHLRKLNIGGTTHLTEDGLEALKELENLRTLEVASVNAEGGLGDTILNQPELFREFP